MAIFVPDHFRLTDWQKLPVSDRRFTCMQDKPAYTDISLSELMQLQHNPDTVVIDVRDEWEFDQFNIGGLNIPLPSIREHKDRLAPYNTLIFICTNGVRSRIAAKDALRQQELNTKTILHLNGGILETE